MDNQQMLIADLTKKIRMLRNDANYFRCTSYGGSEIADVMEEIAMSFEKTLNKYDIVVPLRKGDSRGMGWNVRSPFGFGMMTIHLR